jgi:hypothetical protein
MSEKTAKEVLVEAIVKIVPQGEEQDHLLVLVDELEDELYDEVDGKVLLYAEACDALAAVRKALEVKATLWKCSVAHCGHVFERDQNRCPVCYG